MKRKIHYLLLAALASLLLAIPQRAGAQCPGPSQRTMLINLQRANVLGSTRAGQIPLTDTCGNQRYLRQVQINLDTINYIPAQTGNTANLSEFVFDTLGALWYIDWKGDAIEFSGGGGACDQDWLTISDAQCPESIDDSIYTQKYAAIGARYVWPGATLLVNDSSNINGALMVVQGERAVKIALYDILNEQWTMLHGNNTDMAVYMPQDGSFTVTTASGTPENATADVTHFNVNTLDSTVTLNQYPNTRRDTQAVENFLYTDDMGTIRSQSVDSLPYPAQVNIYTDDGIIEEERIVNIKPTTGGLLTFKTILSPSGLAELTIGDTVFYTNVGGGSVSRWEILPWRQEISSYTGAVGTYIRTFQGANAQIFAGRTATNSQLIVDSVGIKAKTNTSFGTTGQVLRNVNGYMVWQDTAASPSVVNIYNSNGSISTDRTVTLSDTVLWDIASAAGAFHIEGLNNSYFRQSDNAIVTGTGGASFNLGSGTPIAMSMSLDAGTARVTDNRAGKVGIEYASASYGSAFTDSSIVHQRHVANMINDSINTNTVQPPPVENIENSTFTAIKWLINEVDCSGGAITVDPPASPVIKDRFAIVDSNANAATNNITIDFTTATQKLNGSVQDFIMNCDGCYIEFVYMGSTTGWISTK